MVTRSQPQQKSNGEQSLRKVVLSRTIHVTPCAETVTLSTNPTASDTVQEDGRRPNQLETIGLTQDSSVNSARSRSDLDRDSSTAHSCWQDKEESDEFGYLKGDKQYAGEGNHDNKAAGNHGRSRRHKNGVTKHRHCWVSREDEFDSLPQPESNSSIASNYECSVIIADGTGSVETPEKTVTNPSSGGDDGQQEMGDEERSKATVVRGLLSTAGFIWLPPMCLPVSTLPADNLKDCALACGRHSNRRNALADPLTLPLTQQRKEELINEAQDRQKSISRRISQFFLRSSPSECEIDLI